MIRMIEEHGPYVVIAPGLALAHARPGPDVLADGLAVVTLEGAGAVRASAQRPGARRAGTRHPAGGDPPGIRRRHRQHFQRFGCRQCAIAAATTADEVLQIMGQGCQ
jgi:hypothetical protein